MQTSCSICKKEFNDKVGMSPLQGNLAIRVRNKIGNICPECRTEYARPSAAAGRCSSTI